MTPGHRILVFSDPGHQILGGMEIPATAGLRLKCICVGKLWGLHFRVPVPSMRLVNYLRLNFSCNYLRVMWIWVSGEPIHIHTKHDLRHSIPVFEYSSLRIHWPLVTIILIVQYHILLCSDITKHLGVATHSSSIIHLRNEEEVGDLNASRLNYHRWTCMEPPLPNLV